MRLVLQRETEEPAVRDGEILAYVERHRAELTLPATLTLSHVFFSAEARGDALEADALATLERLRSGSLSPAEGLESSDPFPLGNRLRAYSQLAVQGRFGKPFADSVFALAPEEWSGPIASPFGLHLVRIEERTPPSLPPLEVLRPTAMRALAAEQARQRLARGLARLRALYEIRIEDAAATAREVVSVGPPFSRRG
jgi:parvulin-like peptidyl-prolyl isomerase